MGALLDFAQQLATETCCNCGITFAMPREVQTRRREDHKNFYCPNGHAQCYTGQTEAQKLAKELERMKSSKEYWEKRFEREAEETAHTKRRLYGTQGVLAKTKKRIAAGKCPRCKESFPNLADHMKCEHPDYAEPAK